MRRWCPKGCGKKVYHTETIRFQNGYGGVYECRRCGTIYILDTDQDNKMKPSSKLKEVSKSDRKRIERAIYFRGLF